MPCNGFLWCFSISYKHPFSAILKGLISSYTLYRHLQFLTVFVLAFGWQTVSFAEDFQDTYCTCVRQTCESGSCNYKGCAEAFPGSGLMMCDHPIWLLQPLNDDPLTPISPTTGQPFQAFNDYFERSWYWIIGSAAGIAVLWAIFAGIEIMLSGGGTMRDKGKEHLLSALAGLLLIGLAGMILQILNPTYYVQ